MSSLDERKGSRERILVFRVGHFGDTVVALPAFWALRRAYPDAHLAYLTNKPGQGASAVPSVEVLPGEGLFDEIIGYKSPGAGRIPFAAISDLLQIRKKGFDKVFYLMTRNREVGSIRRDRLFFRLSGVREVAGAQFLIDNRLPQTEEGPLPELQDEGGFLLDLLSAEGIEVSEIPQDILRLSGAEIETGREWIHQNTPYDPEEGGLIGVGPGSKWPSKVWPEERFRDVVAELIKERGVFPIVFGGPEDAALAERLVAYWGRGVSSAGVLDVRQGAAALKFCDLYLGNDTGTTHLAAAVGVRCLAIFAAVHYPGRWNPRGEGHRVLRVSVPCEGCHSPDCPNELLCLNSIGTEIVVRTALEMLDEQRK